MSENAAHLDAYKTFLDSCSAEQRLRTLPPHRNADEWLDLTSNDYMGLSRLDALLRREFNASFPDAGFSASASRLLALDQKYHDMLERYLSDLYSRPALLFNSGYHANCGIIAALNLPKTLFVADKLIHASMIDGLTAGRCNFKRFPHNDIHALETILNKERDNYDRFIVLTESIYSMDGDSAPLSELVELKHAYSGVMLYVDEVHAFGVRGSQGLGLAEEKGLIPDIDILIGTLGKAAYSSGAFCITSPLLRDFLVNTARSFIFSTALPPAQCAWSMITIRQLAAMTEERRKLARLGVNLRHRIAEAGFRTVAGDSPIVPLITGDAAKAVELSRHLSENKILALPIRRPTVPPGSERLRLSLHADMTESDIDRILDVISSTID